MSRRLGVGVSPAKSLHNISISHVNNNNSGMIMITSHSKVRLSCVSTHQKLFLHQKLFDRHHCKIFQIASRPLLRWKSCDRVSTVGAPVQTIILTTTPALTCPGHVTHGRTPDQCLPGAQHPPPHHQAAFTTLSGTGDSRQANTRNGELQTILQVTWSNNKIF